MLARLFTVLQGRGNEGLAGMPGPQPQFPLGNAGDFLRPRPWEVCAHYGQRYGGITLVWLLGRPAVILNDPELIGQVLDSRAADFRKSAPVLALRPVITPGSLFITNFGCGWQEARRDNPFSTVAYEDWLTRQVQPLRAVVTEVVKSWVLRSRGGPLDLYWDMQRLLFDVFSEAFWGRTFPSDRFAWFRTLASTGSRRMLLTKPILPPLSPFFYRARLKWYESFRQLVVEASRNPDPEAADLLNVALATGTPLSHEALAEALATNFFGGVFSCSSTVNSTLYLLAKQPKDAAKVMRAVRDDLPEGFDRRALDACRPLESAIREAMRYYPAVPIYFRSSPPDREVRLGPYSLPPNTQVFISNWYLHKFSPHWQEPDRFDPDRWDDAVVEANPYGSGHFFPFGRGPRACIGAAFGQLVHRLVLATLYRECEPELDPNQSYRQSFFFGVMMPKGLNARFGVRT
jgi:cytochrome P450